MVKTPDQIAYFVPDIREAAAQHAATFGSGPFYVAEHIRFSSCLYRGQPSDWDHSSSFGQWGDVMIEFMQQNKPGPSSLHDVFPEGSNRYGVHHMAYIIDDAPSHAAELAGKGIETILHGVLTNGIEVIHVDTRARYGHLIELCTRSKALSEVYDFIREQSVGWGGSDPVRTIEL
ncbi:VOC family protein [Sphingomonas sp. MG17]|uniref:VOC family protein n=1 Tax=Sphingomonas tagetis TaxID=2949092 RepID=A0A9X2HM85_9SPHN|nr:VOC family protein [Sphingomonas tagetis]